MSALLPFDCERAEFRILVDDLPKCEVFRVAPPILDLLLIIISDAGKKAPELGVFSLEVKPGWDYPRARPSWRGANGACSD